MYYIRKFSDQWAVHNRRTGESRSLDEVEIQSILSEFPNLKMGISNNNTLTYFRNRITSISDLP